MSSDPAAPLLIPLRVYQGRRVVLGVSGGADSVALLRALVLAGAEVVAAHFDHQLRPESGEDALWVQQLCTELGVTCMLGGAPVEQVAHKRGWTLEEAARRLRYDFLSRVARQQGIQGVITAHTLGDQAETVLWQVLRGELPLGIAARRGLLERPWLGVTRAQLLLALSAWGQDWREDSSNADTRFTRNWLRHQALPLLRTRFAGLDESLSRLAGQVRQDNAALESLSHLTPHAPRQGQPLALLRRHIRRELQAAGLPFHTAHLETLASAIHSGATLHLDLPGGKPISTTAGHLVLDALRPPTFAQPDFAYPPHWQLRRRAAGDTLRLSGGHQRKLSDVLTDLKVPRQHRDQVWLLAQGQQVQWLGTAPPQWAVGVREVLGVAPDADHAFMGLALQQAHAAAAAQEVPVGAVMVRGAQVIAAASNTSKQAGDMTRHAELEAIRAACAQVGPYLTDCTLYVTLEPCPMCLGAMLEARLARVVYAAANPRAGALGGVHDLLAHHWGHALSVTPGVRAQEAAGLLRRSFAQMRNVER